MATMITVQFTIGDKTLMVSSPPKAIARMVEHHSGGELKALFRKIIDDRLELTDVMTVLRVIERNDDVIDYLTQVIAADGEAEAAAREAVAVLVMAGVASGFADTFER